MARSSSKPRQAILGATAVLGAVVATTLCLFAVGDGERAVVTSFGRPVQVVTTPGLGVKLPYESVTKFDGRLFVYQPPLSEFLTLEKTAVTAAGAVMWRIAEPKRFFETVLNKAGAESRLGDILSAELGAAIGRSPLAAFVSAEAYRAEALLAEVAAKCRNVALRDYGIEVLDVQLLRFGAIVAEVRAGVQALVAPAYGIEVIDLGVRELALPQQNRQSVFERMKAERARITMQLRSDGKAESRRIIAEADRQKARILAEANEHARRLDGEGEAEAMRVYAREFGADLPFFKLVRTLEAYDRILDDKTTLFLPAESELLQMLQPSASVARDLNPPPKGRPRNGETVGAGVEGQQPPSRGESP